MIVHHLLTRQPETEETDEEAAYREDLEKLKAVEDALSRNLPI